MPGCAGPGSSDGSTNGVRTLGRYTPRAIKRAGKLRTTGRGMANRTSLGTPPPPPSSTPTTGPARDASLDEVGGVGEAPSRAPRAAAPNVAHEAAAGAAPAERSDGTNVVPAASVGRSTFSCNRLW